MKKTFRFYIALWIAKAAMLLQKLLGMNASYFPGKLAIKLCPDFLGRIDKPETVITVTGTNGKTTCCNLLLEVLTKNGYDVLNNKAGSNIDAGLASSLIAEASLTGKVSKKLALFEVDERSSPRIYPYVHPNYTVCTNLFRDSITRNAHPEFIFSVIDRYIPADTHMILNADDPISSRLAINNERTYFSIGRMDSDRDECVNIIQDMRMCPSCHHMLEYEYVRYHQIGKAKCPKCGFKSPEGDFVGSPDWETQTLTVHTGEGDELYPMISGSKFNNYNQVTVISLLRTMGLSAESIRKAFGSMDIVKSRYSVTECRGRQIITNMTKGQNPVACSCVFDYVRTESGIKEVIIMLDDLSYKASSEIMTWIYDADFEFLNDDSIARLVVCGVRCFDYRLRLLLAGVPEEKIVCVSDEAESPSKLILDGTDKIFILHDLTQPKMTATVRDGVVAELERRAAQ